MEVPGSPVTHQHRQVEPLLPGRSKATRAFTGPPAPAPAGDPHLKLPDHYTCPCLLLELSAFTSDPGLSWEEDKRHPEASPRVDIGPLDPLQASAVSAYHSRGGGQRAILTELHHRQPALLGGHGPPQLAQVQHHRQPHAAPGERPPPSPTPCPPRPILGTISTYDHRWLSPSCLARPVVPEEQPGCPIHRLQGHLATVSTPHTPTAPHRRTQASDCGSCPRLQQAILEGPFLHLFFSITLLIFYIVIT